MKISGQTFPHLTDEYLNFIKNLKQTHVKDYVNDIDWEFFDSESGSSLTDEISLSGKKIFNYQLAAALIVEAQTFKSKISRKYLNMVDWQNSFTIALFDMNQLFIAPDSSVWVFWHSSLEIERQASNFQEWLKINEPPKIIYSNDVPEEVFGSWKPIATDNKEYPDSYDMFPDFVINPDNTWLEIFEGEIEHREWTLEVDRNELIFHMKTKNKNDITKVISVVDFETIYVYLAGDVITYSKEKSSSE